MKNPSQLFTRHAAVLGAIIAAVSCQSVQAATIFRDANGTWGDGSWVGDVAPGATNGQADAGGVNSGRSVTLNSDITGALGTITSFSVGNQTSTATTAVSSLTLGSSADADFGNLYVGTNGAPGGFTYQDGANLDITTHLLLGSNSDSGAIASTMTFDLGATGLTHAISVGSIFQLRQTYVNQNLVINAASYTGGAQTFDLVQFTTLSGTFNELNITFNGLEGKDLAGAIGYDADSMFVTFTAIPEPGTYALLAGLTGLVFVMVRRRS